MAYAGRSRRSSGLLPRKERHMFSTPPAARDHRRTADEHLTAFYIMQCTFYPFAALLLGDLFALFFKTG